MRRVLPDERGDQILIDHMPLDVIEGDQVALGHAATTDGFGPDFLRDVDLRKNADQN